MRDCLVSPQENLRRSNELPRPTWSPLSEYQRTPGRPMPSCDESSTGPNSSIHQPPLTIALGKLGIDLHLVFGPGFLQSLLTFQVALPPGA